MKVVAKDLEEQELPDDPDDIDGEREGSQAAPSSLLRRVTHWFSRRMPKGLYARALIIITAPLILLQSILVFVFMERHYELVTKRLSRETANQIAAMVSIYDQLENKQDFTKFNEIARNKMGLVMELLPPGPLPPLQRRPFYDILDRVLSKEIAKKVRKPYRIRTSFSSNTVTIYIQVSGGVFRIVTNKSKTYASNSHIFLVWMVSSSIVLLIVAILFLRNQIKPILQLTEAARCFGMGRPAPEDFRPRGAREVRQAAQAFIRMRDRIERHVDQRTTMLAGVSHDLRTILTRFKLELALAGDSPEIEALKADVDEMQSMLEDYMAFAKGDGSEDFEPSDIMELLIEVRDDFKRLNHDVELRRITELSLEIPLRRQAFKRVISNLVSNAVRIGKTVRLTVDRDDRWIRIYVEDDGPGIPEKERAQVFRPFYRLDAARNQDSGGTGLGLSIARDIARSHGGEITLQDSALGGLKAIVRLPI